MFEHLDVLVAALVAAFATYVLGPTVGSLLNRRSTRIKNDGDLWALYEQVIERLDNLEDWRRRVGEYMDHVEAAIARTPEQYRPVITMQRPVIERPARSVQRNKKAVEE